MKPITVDIINNKVIMTRAFAAKAADPYSSEYAKLQAIKETFPNIKIVNHTIKKNPNKECYRGLTYDYMRRYILTHESEKTIEAAIKDFEKQLFLSECHSVRYPTVKRWFLEKYEEVAKFGVKEEVVDFAEVEPKVTVDFESLINVA